MKTKTREKIAEPSRIFHLPKYEDIPDVGLYLEQTVKYINSYFDSFDGMNLTASMVSNYVKKGLVANAVKKQYYREQIAYLFCHSNPYFCDVLQNIRETLLTV